MGTSSAPPVSSLDEVSQVRPGQTRYGLRSLRKRNLTLSGIDLWGLAGILLVLLSMFMVIVPTPPTSQSTNRLPAVNATSMPGALKEDAMRVAVTADGSIYFGNSQVAADELPERIRESVTNGEDRKIYMVVDARAKYSGVEKVIDQIRLTGINDVTFLTDQPFSHR